MDGFPVHAAIVGGKIIRRENGAANDHRVGGIRVAADHRSRWSRPPYATLPSYKPKAAFISVNTWVFSIVPLNGAEPEPAAYSLTSPPPCDSLDQRTPVSWW